MSAGLAPVVERVVAMGREVGMQEPASRLVREASTPRAAGTMVVALGSAGAGTSSVVSALLGRPGWLAADRAAVPVPGPQREAYVVCRFGTPRAVAHHLDGRAVEVPVEDVGRAARGEAAGSGPLARAIEVELLAPALSDGVVLVDVPGLAGAGDTRERDTEALVQRADALLHVTSAAAPVDRRALELLAGATERVSTLVVACNRIDQFPGWREVVEDTQRLLETGLPHLRELVVVPVSARLAEHADLAREQATLPADVVDDLEVESGIPQLRGILRAELEGRGQALRLANVARVARVVLRDVAAYHRGMLEVDDDDATALQGAHAEIVAYREAATAAGRELADGMARAREQVSTQLQRGLRAAADAAETRLAAPRVDAEEVLAALLADLSELDRTLALGVLEAVDDLRMRLEERLGEPLQVALEAEGAAGLLGDRLTAATTVAEVESSAAAASQGRSLNVASMLVSSTTTVGILGQRLSAGGVDPLVLLLGTGAVLGAARFVTSLRSARRRQDVSGVRGRVRAVLEEVRQALPAALREQLTTVQRQLEDEVRRTVGGRSDELNRRYEQLQQAAAVTAESRARSMDVARARLSEVADLERALLHVEAAR